MRQNWLKIQQCGLVQPHKWKAMKCETMSNTAQRVSHSIFCHVFHLVEDLYEKDRKKWANTAENTEYIIEDTVQKYCNTQDVSYLMDIRLNKEQIFA